MTEVQYLSFDSLAEGVGASQVLAYARKVSVTHPIKIISFEKEMPDSIAFWDNRCAQHKALWDYWPNVRSGFRVQIEGVQAPLPG